MIDRNRVRRLASGDDAASSKDKDGPRGASVADEDWREPCKVLAAIVAAQTIEEFDRLEPGFGPAYRRLRDFAWKAKRAPRPGNSMSMSRDEELTSAVLDLWAVVKANGLFHDATAFPRPFAVRKKLLRLLQLCGTYTDFHGANWDRRIAGWPVD